MSRNRKKCPQCGQRNDCCECHAEGNSKDRFAQSLIDALRDSRDSREFRYDKGDFRLKESNRAEINLGKLYFENCQLPFHERKVHIERIVEAVLSMRDQLPESFDDAQEHLRPKVVPRTMYSESKLRERLNNEKTFDSPFDPLGSHLVTTVVYDLPAKMQFLSNDDFEKWGVSFNEAMEIACRNLNASSFVFSKIGDGFYFAATNDNYDSSRILLKNHISSREVTGDHIALVPQRDALCVTGSDDDLGLEMMIQAAEQTINDNPRPLSPFPLRLVDGEWKDCTFPRAHELSPKFRQLENQFLGRLYCEQKTLLDAIHAKEGVDAFVGSYIEMRKDSTGEIATFCSWASNCTSLLPKTDIIMLDVGEEPVPCNWDRVVHVAGYLLEPVADLYPLRYRVSQFPTDDQVEQIGRVEL